MTLASIVRALGGELYAGGRRASVPGPGHSPADRSVSLLLDGDRVVVHAFAGEDWREVLDDLRGRGLVDRDGRLIGSPAAGASPHELAATERQARARALWEAAVPVGGTLSERHCRRRCVRRELGGQLRHHPAVPSAVYRDEGFRRPALLAAIRDSGGSLCGVEVTYLAPNAERARLRIPRKTIGTAPAGSAVRLDPPARRLLVAEGVFSALSAAERFGLPAWALLSTRNLRSWAPPAGVEAVVIAADRGGDGARSAGRLAGRLAALAVTAEIRWPPAPHGDWNEAAAAAGDG
jgi:hypothetical protein